MKRLNLPVLKLTKTTIAALLVPASGREEIRDSVEKSLVLRITSTGAKSWCVFMRVKGGEPVRVGIGKVETLSPTVARLRAKEIATDLAVGIVPAEELSLKAKVEAARERKQHTLESLAQAYVDFQKSRGRSSYKDAQSIFKTHLLERAPELASKQGHYVA